MTPLSKQSKKARKAFYASKRKTWNGLSPVTRVIKDRKKFDRNSVKRFLKRGSEDD